MSTTYYALREPFLSVTVAYDGETVVIRLAAHHGDCELRGSADLAAPFLLGIADKHNQIAYRSNGVAVIAHVIPDGLQVISEDGDLTTIGELRRGVAP